MKFIVWIGWTDSQEREIDYFPIEQFDNKKRNDKKML